jgi:sulfur-carrier protein
MVKILYFARMAETLGTVSEELDLPAHVRDVATLMRWLGSRGEVWGRELSQDSGVRVSVNRGLVTLQAGVKDGDEVAFFPGRG